MIRLLVILCVLVITPVVGHASSFTVSQNLSFGTLVPVTTSGSVTIALNSSITTGSSVTVAPSGTGYYAGRGVYNGTGLSNVLEILTITVLSSSVTLSNGSGGTVSVDNFTTTPNLLVGLLANNIAVNVGGRMNFTSTSGSGVYTGSVQVRGSSALSGNATMTLPIRLTLWRPLSISQTTGMNFGGIESLTGNSVVRLATSGTRTITSGVSGVNLIAGNPGSAGIFKVTGNPNTAITITLPSSITLTGPGAAMTVNNFTRSPTSTSAIINSGGNLTLRIGADLTVNAGQAAGTYNGIYPVTVSY